MEYEKIIKLLDNTAKQPSKFTLRAGIFVDREFRGTNFWGHLSRN